MEELVQSKENKKITRRCFILDNKKNNYIGNEINPKFEDFWKMQHLEAFLKNLKRNLQPCSCMVETNLSGKKYTNRGLQLVQSKLLTKNATWWIKK